MGDDREFEVSIRYTERLGDTAYPVYYLPGDDGNLRDMDEVTLGTGEYFFLGDNRDHSRDSRAFGPVNGVRIKGKALVVYLPGPGADRWDRMGRLVR